MGREQAQEIQTPLGSSALEIGMAQAGRFVALGLTKNSGFGAIFGAGLG